MALFSKSQAMAINKVAEKTRAQFEPPKKSAKASSVTAELEELSQKVRDYFKDSPAILITNVEELDKYIDKCIEYGYAGLDTETTGVDRLKDHLVGASLYVPGMPECYIPMKHKIPIFEDYRPNQISYEDFGKAIKKLCEGGTKLILANSDFDIAMIYHDTQVGIEDNVYYDVLTAWRCLKENEKDNSLKGLYNKYPLKGQGDPMKFRDFFTPQLFPYSDPNVAKLYAANDAKITFDLFKWQLPYVTKDDVRCQKAHLERVADLIWSVEFPVIKVCATLHRNGIYLDYDIASFLKDRYRKGEEVSRDKLAKEVQTLIDEKDTATNMNRPFRTGKDFNPNSNIHVKYLLNNLLHANADSTGKEVLNGINVPVTNAILDVRGYVKLLSTYVEKLPGSTGDDDRIHATFKALGADTGRMASAEPNLQNIPSKASDIRHMFRATPALDKKFHSDDNTLVIRVPRIATVKSQQNEEVRIEDLFPGDIILEDDGSSLVVVAIDKSSDGFEINVEFRSYASGN